MEFLASRRRYSIYAPNTSLLSHDLFRFSDTGTLNRTPTTEQEVQICGSEPDVKTPASRIKQYLKEEIFPALTPAIDSMLRVANAEKCFQKKLTKFRPLDFLTQYLYRHNPSHPDREAVQFEEIPFVAEWLKNHPRGPLPKFLLWTEEEAAIIIQSYFRGYLVRRTMEVQEMRKYQKMLEGHEPALMQQWQQTRLLPEKHAVMLESIPTPWEICLGLYRPTEFNEGCDFTLTSDRKSQSQEGSNERDLT